jgi:hypothetical protein
MPRIVALLRRSFDVVGVPDTVQAVSHKITDRAMHSFVSVVT